MVSATKARKVVEPVARTGWILVEHYRVLFAIVFLVHVPWSIVGTIPLIPIYLALVPEALIGTAMTGAMTLAVLDIF